MKKILFFGLALAAFASCSKDQVVETPQGAAIGFGNVFVENATRAATDLTKGSFDFGVYGTVAKDGNNALIFDNKTVAADGTYSPVQYWIAGAEYTFTAYAPFTNAKWSFAATDAYNGTLSFNNAEALGEQDLLFANADRTTPASIAAQPDVVSLTFSHLLSKVAFKFTNQFTDNNITLKVYNVKVNNAAATGTMPVVDGVDGDWTGADDYARSFGPATADEVATINNNGGELSVEHFYLIPVKRAYNITFDVDLYQAGVKLQTYNHTVNANIALEKGKSYSLNATLAPENVNPAEQLYPIEFAVNAVENWTEGTVDVTPKTTKVATAEALATALAAGENVVLTADVALDEALVLEKSAVIDLGGKTLSTSKGIYVSGVASAPISVKSGTVTVKNGTVNAAAYGDYAVEVRGGNLVIEDGTYVGSVTAVNANLGHITILGGEFKAKNNGTYGTTYLLNCTDANLKAGTASIVCKGGVYNGFNPADNAAENPKVNFVAEGYQSVETPTGVWTVSAVSAE